MKLKVKFFFRDIDNFSRGYLPGDFVEFPDARAKHIIALGLAEEAVAQPINHTAESIGELPTAGTDNPKPKGRKIKLPILPID